MSDLVPVRLVKYYQGCNPGEVAGFDPELADSLIKAGIAEKFVPESAAPEAPPVDRMVKKGSGVKTAAPGGTSDGGGSQPS